MALLVILVAAVLIVLAVFAWVLLAPLMRSGRGRSAEEGDDGGPTAVLFGRSAYQPRSGRKVGLPGVSTDAARAPRARVAQPTAYRPPTMAARRASVSLVVPAAAQAADALLAAVVAPPAVPIEPVTEVTVAGTAAPRRRRVPPRNGTQPPIADVLLVTADSGLSSSQLAILTASGCASRCAVSASDAVGELRLRRPDLLIVDAANTGEGVRLLAALRTWQATEKLPVVLLTRLGDEETRRRATELHATDVVVGAESLPGLVERALPYWLAGEAVFSDGDGWPLPRPRRSAGPPPAP